MENGAAAVGVSVRTTGSGKMSRAVATYVLRVHFVRHAESLNNARHHDDDDTPDVIVAPLKKRRRDRQPDPSITPKGRRQAEATAEYLQRLLQGNDDGSQEDSPQRAGAERVDAVYTSAMTRALQTAEPAARILGESFGVRAVVWPCLHETGGCFHGDRSAKGAEQPVARGLGPDGVRAILPHAGICVEDFGFHDGEEAQDNLPRIGGWWRGGFEDLEDAKTRAAEVVSRIWELAKANAHAAVAAQKTAGADTTSAEPDTCNARAVVVVVHGNFFNLTLRHLLGVGVPQETHSRDAPAFLTGNCAITTVDFHVKLTDLDAEPEFRLGVVGMNSQDHLPPEIRTGHNLQGCVFKPATVGKAANGSPSSQNGNGK